MDEKLKEMAKEICKNTGTEYCASGKCVKQFDCQVDYRALAILRNAGYRKESDTAREILTELLDFVNGWFEGVEYNDFGVEFNRIAKDFAEKYGVDLGE